MSHFNKISSKNFNGRLKYKTNPDSEETEIKFEENRVQFIPVRINNGNKRHKHSRTHKCCSRRLSSRKLKPELSISKKNEISEGHYLHGKTDNILIIESLSGHNSDSYSEPVNRSHANDLERVSTKSVENALVKSTFNSNQDNSKNGIICVNTSEESIHEIQHKERYSSQKIYITATYIYNMKQAANSCYESIIEDCPKSDKAIYFRQNKGVGTKVNNTTKRNVELFKHNRNQHEEDSSVYPFHFLEKGSNYSLQFNGPFLDDPPRKEKTKKNVCKRECHVFEHTKMLDICPKETKTCGHGSRRKPLRERSFISSRIDNETDRKQSVSKVCCEHKSATTNHRNCCQPKCMKRSSSEHHENGEEPHCGKTGKRCVHSENRYFCSNSCKDLSYKESSKEELPELGPCLGNVKASIDENGKLEILKMKKEKEIVSIHRFISNKFIPSSELDSIFHFPPDGEEMLPAKIEKHDETQELDTRKIKAPPIRTEPKSITAGKSGPDVDISSSLPHQESVVGNKETKYTDNIEISKDKVLFIPLKRKQEPKRQKYDPTTGATNIANKSKIKSKSKIDSFRSKFFRRISNIFLPKGMKKHDDAIMNKEEHNTPRKTSRVPYADLGKINIAKFISNEKIITYKKIQQHDDSEWRSPGERSTQEGKEHKIPGSKESKVSKKQKEIPPSRGTHETDELSNLQTTRSNISAEDQKRLSFEESPLSLGGDHKAVENYSPEKNATDRIEFDEMSSEVEKKKKEEEEKESAQILWSTEDENLRFESESSARRESSRDRSNTADSTMNNEMRPGFKFGIPEFERKENKMDTRDRTEGIDSNNEKPATGDKTEEHKETHTAPSDTQQEGTKKELILSAEASDHSDIMKKTSEYAGVIIEEPTPNKMKEKNDVSPGLESIRDNDENYGSLDLIESHANARVKSSLVSKEQEIGIETKQKDNISSQENEDRISYNLQNTGKEATIVEKVVFQDEGNGITNIQTPDKNLEGTEPTDKVKLDIIPLRESVDEKGEIDKIPHGERESERNINDVVSGQAEQPNLDTRKEMDHIVRGERNSATFNESDPKREEIEEKEDAKKDLKDSANVQKQGMQLEPTNDHHSSDEKNESKQSIHNDRETTSVEQKEYEEIENFKLSMKKIKSADMIHDKKPHGEAIETRTTRDDRTPVTSGETATNQIEIRNYVENEVYESSMKNKQSTDMIQEGQPRDEAIKSGATREGPEKYDGPVSGSETEANKNEMKIYVDVSDNFTAKLASVNETEEREMVLSNDTTGKNVDETFISPGDKNQDYVSDREKLNENKTRRGIISSRDTQHTEKEFEDNVHHINGNVIDVGDDGMIKLSKENQEIFPAYDTSEKNQKEKATPHKGGMEILPKHGIPHTGKIKDSDEGNSHRTTGVHETQKIDNSIMGIPSHELLDKKEKMDKNKEDKKKVISSSPKISDKNIKEQETKVEEKDVVVIWKKDTPGKTNGTQNNITSHVASYNKQEIMDVMLTEENDTPDIEDGNTPRDINENLEIGSSQKVLMNGEEFEESPLSVKEKIPKSIEQEGMPKLSKQKIISSRKTPDKTGDSQQNGEMANNVIEETRSRKPERFNDTEEKGEISLDREALGKVKAQHTAVTDRDKRQKVDEKTQKIRSSLVVENNEEIGGGLLAKEPLSVVMGRKGKKQGIEFEKQINPRPEVPNDDGKMKKSMNSKDTQKIGERIRTAEASNKKKFFDLERTEKTIRDQDTPDIGKENVGQDIKTKQETISNPEFSHGNKKLLNTFHDKDKSNAFGEKQNKTYKTREINDFMNHGGVKKTKELIDSPNDANNGAVGSMKTEFRKEGKKIIPRYGTPGKKEIVTDSSKSEDKHHSDREEIKSEGEAWRKNDKIPESEHTEGLIPGKDDTKEKLKHDEVIDMDRKLQKIDGETRAISSHEISTKPKRNEAIIQENDNRYIRKENTQDKERLGLIRGDQPSNNHKGIESNGYSDKMKKIDIQNEERKNKFKVEPQKISIRESSDKKFVRKDSLYREEKNRTGAKIDKLKEEGITPTQAKKDSIKHYRTEYIPDTSRGVAENDFKVHASQGEKASIKNNDKAKAEYTPAVVSETAHLSKVTNIITDKKIGKDPVTNPISAEGKKALEKNEIISNDQKLLNKRQDSYADVDGGEQISSKQEGDMPTIGKRINKTNKYPNQVTYMNDTSKELNDTSFPEMTNKISSQMKIAKDTKENKYDIERSAEKKSTGKRMTKNENEKQKRNSSVKNRESNRKSQDVGDKEANSEIPKTVKTYNTINRKVSDSPEKVSDLPLIKPKSETNLVSKTDANPIEVSHKDIKTTIDVKDPFHLDEMAKSTTEYSKPHQIEEKTTPVNQKNRDSAIERPTSSPKRVNESEISKNIEHGKIDNQRYTSTHEKLSTESMPQSNVERRFSKLIETRPSDNLMETQKITVNNKNMSSSKIPQITTEISDDTYPKHINEFIERKKINENEGYFGERKVTTKSEEVKGVEGKVKSESMKGPPTTAKKGSASSYSGRRKNDKLPEEENKSSERRLINKTEAIDLEMNDALVSSQKQILEDVPKSKQSFPFEIRAQERDIPGSKLGADVIKQILVPRRINEFGNEHSTVEGKEMPTTSSAKIPERSIATFVEPEGASAPSTSHSRSGIRKKGSFVPDTEPEKTMQINTAIRERDALRGDSNNLMGGTTSKHVTPENSIFGVQIELENIQHPATDELMSLHDHTTSTEDHVVSTGIQTISQPEKEQQTDEEGRKLSEEKTKFGKPSDSLTMTDFNNGFSKRPKGQRKKVSIDESSIVHERNNGLAFVQDQPGEDGDTIVHRYGAAQIKESSRTGSPKDFTEIESDVKIMVNKKCDCNGVRKLVSGNERMDETQLLPMNVPVKVLYDRRIKLQGKMRCSPARKNNHELQLRNKVLKGVSSINEMKNQESLPKISPKLIPHLVISSRIAYEPLFESNDDSLRTKSYNYFSNSCDKKQSKIYPKCICTSTHRKSYFRSNNLKALRTEKRLSKFTLNKLLFKQLMNSGKDFQILPTAEKLRILDVILKKCQYPIRKSTIVIQIKQMQITLNIKGIEKNPNKKLKKIKKRSIKGIQYDERAYEKEKKLKKTKGKKAKKINRSTKATTSRIVNNMKSHTAEQEQVCVKRKVNINNLMQGCFGSVRKPSSVHTYTKKKISPCKNDMNNIAEQTVQEPLIGSKAEENFNDGKSKKAETNSNFNDREAPLLGQLEFIDNEKSVLCEGLKKSVATQDDHNYQKEGTMESSKNNGLVSSERLKVKNKKRRLLQNGKNINRPYHNEISSDSQLLVKKEVNTEFIPKYVPYPRTNTCMSESRHETMLNDGNATKLERPSNFEYTENTQLAKAASRCLKYEEKFSITKLANSRDSRELCSCKLKLKEKSEFCKCGHRLRYRPYSKVNCATLNLNKCVGDSKFSGKPEQIKKLSFGNPMNMVCCREFDAKMVSILKNSRNRKDVHFCTIPNNYGVFKASARAPFFNNIKNRVNGIHGYIREHEITEPHNEFDIFACISSDEDEIFSKSEILFIKEMKEKFGNFGIKPENGEVVKTECERSCRNDKSTKHGIENTYNEIDRSILSNEDIFSKSEIIFIKEMKEKFGIFRNIPGNIMNFEAESTRSPKKMLSCLKNPSTNRIENYEVSTSNRRVHFQTPVSHNFSFKKNFNESRNCGGCPPKKLIGQCSRTKKVEVNRFQSTVTTNSIPRPSTKFNKLSADCRTPNRRKLPEVKEICQRKRIQSKSEIKTFGKKKKTPPRKLKNHSIQKNTKRQISEPKTICKVSPKKFYQVAFLFEIILFDSFVKVDPRNCNYEDIEKKKRTKSTNERNDKTIDIIHGYNDDLKNSVLFIRVEILKKYGSLVRRLSDSDGSFRILLQKFIASREQRRVSEERN